MTITSETPEFLEVWDVATMCHVERKTVYRFMSGGCSQVLSLWLEEGMQESPEAVAKEMNEMCAAVLTAYVQ